MRIAGFVEDSIVDGPGLRLTIFAQGCTHHCQCCHNPETHALDGGTEVSLETIKNRIKASHLITGITLSGGDPMEQAEDCAQIAAFAHSLGLNVWTYTGYTMEQLLEEGREDRIHLLEETDILVDGPFVLAERSLDCVYRGSQNQRLLDAHKSLEAESAIFAEL